MKHKRNITVILSTSSLAALCFLGLGPTQAAQAASCQGASCAGKDPVATGCADDAWTVYAMDVGGWGMLELRYSNKCRANWGRFTSYLRSGSQVTHGDIYAWNPGGQLNGLAGRGGNWWNSAQSWWTKMVDGNQVACTGTNVLTATTAGNGQRWEARHGWYGNLCG